MDEARLSAQWSANPGDARLAVELATLMVRQGRALAARDVLATCWRASEDPSLLCEAAARMGVDVWAGGAGGAPWRSWLAPPPESQPTRDWGFVSPHRDDRFGLPVCVVADTVCMVAQSVVVGIRWVRLVCLDATTGRIRWEQERRDVVGPGGAFVVGGRRFPIAVGWAYAHLGDEGLQLCVDVFRPEDGVQIGGDVFALDDAIMASPGQPQPLGADASVLWPVVWITDDARRQHTFRVDAADGSFRETSVDDDGHDWDAVVGCDVGIVVQDASGIYLQRSEERRRERV